MPQQISVFVIYAREDHEIKQRLLKHLNPLKDSYNLNIWHDDFIEPGQEWKPHIESRLEQTDLFLLLVSADFMDSTFIHQVEFKFAIDRHKQNRSVVIPVIINYCLWDIDIRYSDYTFSMSELQVLPDGAKPIDDWKTPEQAYHNIAAGIRKVLSTIKNNRELKTAEENKKEEERKQQEENVKNQNEKDKKERENALQREEQQKQIAKQKETGQHKELPPPIHEEVSGNTGASKKIIYASLIAVAVLCIFYFIFRKSGKSSGDDSGTYGTTPTYSGESGQTGHSEIHDTSKLASVEPQKIKPSPSKSEALSNTFSRFPEALAFVFKNAANNFADLKGTYVGMEDRMRKYKTKVTLYDKAFRSLYIYQDARDWKFEFTNESYSNYQSLKSAIVNLLKSNNIQYEYESSASIAADRYTWGNGNYEILLLVRKESDNYLVVTISHQN